MKYFFWGSIGAIAIVYLLEASTNKIIVYCLSIVICIATEQPYYLAVVLGVILADLYTAQKLYLNRIAKILLLVLYVYFGAYPTGMQAQYGPYSIMSYSSTLAEYSHIFAALCMVVLVLQKGLLSKVFESRIMQFTGKISVAVYIVHYGILISFTSWLFTRLSSCISNYNAKVGITALCSIVMIMVLSLGINQIIVLINKVLEKAYNKVFEKNRR